MTIEWSTLDGARKGTISSTTTNRLLATCDWLTPHYVRWSFAETLHRHDRGELQRIVQHIEQWYAAQQPAPLMQITVDNDDSRSVTMLQAFGWQLVTHVVYWGAIPAPQVVTPHVRLCPYRDVSRAVFHDVFCATQQDTRDSPLWLDLAESVDWVDVFHAACGGCVDDWYLIFLEDDAIGCVVLCDPPQAHTGIEWHYLGILPKWRNRGWGVHTVWAVRDLANRRGRSLIVAVDQHNGPAQRVYERGGLSRLCACALLAKTRIS